MDIARLWKGLTEHNVRDTDAVATPPDWDPEAEQRKEQLHAIYEALGDTAIPDYYLPEDWE